MAKFDTDSKQALLALICSVSKVVVIKLSRATENTSEIGDRQFAVFRPIRTVVAVASVCHPAYIQLTIANNLSSCLVSVMLSNKNIAYGKLDRSLTLGGNNRRLKPLVTTNKSE